MSRVSCVASRLGPQASLLTYTGSCDAEKLAVQGRRTRNAFQVVLEARVEVRQYKYFISTEYLGGIGIRIYTVKSSWDNMWFIKLSTSAVLLLNLYLARSVDGRSCDGTMGTTPKSNPEVITGVPECPQSK